MSETSSGVHRVEGFEHYKKKVNPWALARTAIHTVAIAFIMGVAGRLVAELVTETQRCSMYDWSAWGCKDLKVFYAIFITFFVIPSSFSGYMYIWSRADDFEAHNG